jgi:hypothetical protein
MNPCPVCRKDHDGPNGHFCADCMGVPVSTFLSTWVSSKREHGELDCPPPQKVAATRSGFGARVYREDGHGCVERVHPTELLMESGDRGEEGW